MSKIKSIKISNLKSIGEFEANFNGCTAIVTAGNNKGKTTLLKMLPDRIRGEKPDIIVKQGEANGRGEMELTTGEKFEWDVTSVGKEKLKFTTREGIKTDVTKTISNKFFPPVFDIDKFLQSQPKAQSIQLQKALGIDCTEIDAKYQAEYTRRTQINSERDSAIARLTAMGSPAKVEFVTMDELTAKKERVRVELNNKYQSNVAANKQLENDWKAECNRINSEKAIHEKAFADMGYDREVIGSAIAQLAAYSYPNTNELHKWRDETYKLPPVKAFTTPPEPTYPDAMPSRSELDAIDAEIVAASTTNMNAQKYADYVTQQQVVEALKAKATGQDALVKTIEQERKEIIASAKLPVGVEITTDGITVGGLPLDRSQLSTSKLYITALQFGLLNIGDVRTLYFDASYLDRNSLNEVNEWATANDLQLLIERPDFEGGDITYELICNEETEEKGQKELFS